MQNITTKIEHLNWDSFTGEMHDKGFAAIPGLLTNEQCEELKAGYANKDLYGDVYFPIQTVFFLNEPDKDFTGGEFVLTQQTPRAQSKVIVLKT